MEVNGKLTCYTRENGIVTPYDDGFWEVKVRRIQEEKPDPDRINQKPQDIRDYEYKVDIDQVYAYPLGKPFVPKFNIRDLPDFESHEEGFVSYPYQTFRRQLMYVGNRYISIDEQSRIETGGKYEKLGLFLWFV